MGQKYFLGRLTNNPKTNEVENQVFYGGSFPDLCEYLLDEYNTVNIKNVMDMGLRIERIK